MSKTITSALVIGAAIAVNVIPGAGQFISGAILSTVGTSFAAAGIVSAGVGLGITALTVAGVQAASQLAGLGPKVPKPEQTESAVKSSTPPRVSSYGICRLYGAYALYETSASGVAVDIYAVHDGQIDGVERLYLGDAQVATGAGVVGGTGDGAYSDGSVEIDFRLGLPTETAFAQAVVLLPGVWTSAHRGDGVVSAFVSWQPVKSKSYTKIYPSGQPPLSMVARWQLVYDWRDEDQDVSDPSTWGWSQNTWLHIAHYKLVREKSYTASGDVMPTADELTRVWERYFQPTVDFWTICADDADLGVPLKAGGTEERYRSCVSHKHTDPHKAVMGNLLACCDGFIVERADGALLPRPGRYYEPTVTIGPDEIVGYTYEEGVADEAAVNEIAITYVSAEHDYSTVEATSWTDDADIVARGAIRSDTLANQVPSHAQARRLAKRKMAQVMAPKRGSVTTNSGGRAVLGERFIQLLLEEAGANFYDGPAEITALTRNLATGGLTFTWIAADPDIDTWNPATEEGDPAAVGDRIAADPLDAPEITSASATYDDTSVPGNPGARILLTVSGPDRTDLLWFVRTRSSGGSVWNERQYSDIDPGSSVSLLTEYVAFDADVEVETAYGIGDGRISPWSDTETVPVSGGTVDLDAELAGKADASPTTSALDDLETRVAALEAGP